MILQCFNIFQAFVQACLLVLLPSQNRILSSSFYVLAGVLIGQNTVHTHSLCACIRKKNDAVRFQLFSQFCGSILPIGLRGISHFFHLFRTCTCEREADIPGFIIGIQEQEIRNITAFQIPRRGCNLIIEIRRAKKRLISFHQAFSPRYSVLVNRFRISLRIHRIGQLQIKIHLSLIDGIRLQLKESRILQSLYFPKS